jgi:peptidoglycan hydrolase-like protein with peptidoglycan-binding domain
MNILEIQRALNSQGYNPGPLDGIWGRLTMAAVKDFQSRNGLEANGILNEETAQAILARANIPSSGSSGSTKHAGSWGPGKFRGPDRIRLSSTGQPRLGFPIRATTFRGAGYSLRTASARHLAANHFQLAPWVRGIGKDLERS